MAKEGKAANDGDAAAIVQRGRSAGRFAAGVNLSPGLFALPFFYAVVDIDYLMELSSITVVPHHVAVVGIATVTPLWGLGFLFTGRGGWALWFQVWLAGAAVMWIGTILGAKTVSASACGGAFIQTCSYGHNFLSRFWLVAAGVSIIWLAASTSRHALRRARHSA